MATTDPDLAARAVEALASSSVHFALLHMEEELSRRLPISDVDLVVATPAGELMPRWLETLRTERLHPIVLWPYDVGGTATVFITDENASEGAQLDLLYDPDGLGRYGLLTDCILKRTTLGERFPRLGRLDELIYVASKRYVKDQPDALEPVLQELRGWPAREVTEATHLVLAPTQASIVLSLVRGEPPSPRARRLPHRAEIRRLGDRIRRPIGFWVAVTSDHDRLASELAGRFRRFLPHTQVSQAPDRTWRRMRWFVEDIAPVRWRAGLVTTWSPVQYWRPRADLLLRSDGRSLDEAAHDVVSAMERRLSA